jgi:hypothetical protein
MPARTSQAGHRRFLQHPRSSSGGGRLPPHGAPWGPGAMHPLAAGHASPVREHAPVVPGCGSRVSD